MDLEDLGGGGVNLFSNSVPVLSASNNSSSNTEFAYVKGAQANNPVIIGATNLGQSGDVGLELQPQGAGAVISGANLDLKQNALINEFPVNPTGNGVTQNYLVILNGSGADSYTSVIPTHGVIGVATATVSAASGNVAPVAYGGVVQCMFAGNFAINDYVIAGSTSRCQDTGTPATGAPPATKQVIGIALQSGSGPALAQILLRPSY